MDRLDWKAAGIAGLVLAAAVALWQVVSAAAFPGSALFVPVAVLIQFLLIGGLLRTTGERQGYGAQVATGTVASALAAILIALSSVVVSTVLFPGLSAKIGSTPTEGAIAGAVGTFSTGLITSLGLALIWQRR